MQYSDFISVIREKKISVFTVKEASEILGKSRPYTSKFLIGRKEIERIENGKYCIAGADIDAVVSHIVSPSYLSLISAFRYYRLTNQIPKEKFVVSTARHQDFSFHGYRIKFIKASKKVMFGFKEINGVSVATPEKAFIDALYFKKSAWYSEEFRTAIDRDIVDLDVIKRYAKAIGNKALADRLEDFLIAMGYEKDPYVKQLQDNRRMRA